MPYTHFLIPAEGGDAEKRLDVFLRSHAILKIEQRFVDRPEGAFWAYAIHYDPLPAASGSVSAAPKRELGKDRIDYEKVLGERDFALYVKLRDWRSGLAEQQSVPVFSIFHNATLAAIAQARPTTREALRDVPGVGEGKAERYGAAVLALIEGDAPADPKTSA
jgi:superfamily II DNA helicase RecQ